MIGKIKNARNGYFIDESTTDEDFQKIIRLVNVHQDIHCIICNERTSHLFKCGSLGHPIVTINNHLKDGDIYFNGIY